MRLTIGLLLTFLAFKVFPQTKLQYGDNHMARISVLNEYDEYEFTGQTNDIIWIRMRDVTKVDSWINLYDPQGNLIASDWDDGGLADIKDFTLPVDGDYKIRVHDRNHNDIGDYGISLQLVNAPSYASILDCYNNFTETIEQHCAVDVFSFTAEAGDVFYSQMRALTEHLEPEFFLYDENGNQLEKSSRQGRMARIITTLSESGTYYLFITDRGGNDSDQYGFSTQFLNRHECAASIACGQTVNHEFVHLAQRNAYAVKMIPDESAILQMRSPNPSVEMSFEIYDETGTLVSKKTGSDKMISTEMLSSESASYLIIAYDRHGNDFGPYGLHFESISNNQCSQEILCAEQNQFEHTIDAIAQLKTYEINGAKEDTYHFVIKELTKAMEPQIRMYNSSGEMILNVSHSSKVDVTGAFPSDDSYSILIGDKSGNDLGSYTFESLSSNIELSLPAEIHVSKIDPCTDITASYTGILESMEWNTGETGESISICTEEEMVISCIAEFANGCQLSAETKVIIDDTGCEIIDFNDMATGTIMDDEYSFFTISVHNNKGPDLGTIFDSADPPLHCADLGTPNQTFGGAGIGTGGEMGQPGENKTEQKQVLIIAENRIDNNNDGILDFPDDDANGGKITFEFDDPVYVESIKLIDIEEGNHIKSFDQEGNLIKKTDLLKYGDNSMQTLHLRTRDVKKLVITLAGSGGVDDLSICRSTSPPIVASSRSRSKPSSTADHEPIEQQIQQFEKPVLFPNPANHMVNIQLPDNWAGEEIQMHILDLTGRVVHQNILTSQSNPIQLNQQLSAGVYFVQLWNRTSGIREVLHLEILP